MLLDFFEAGEQTMRLHLESVTRTPDRQGRMTQTYALVASIWARVQPVHEEPGPSGEAVITHRIWVSHSNQVNAGMRLRKASRIFSIRTIHDPDESARFLVCQVTEE